MKERTVRALIAWLGVYVTSVSVILSLEYFAIRNGISILIGSQTPFWWLGLTVGLASLFCTAYFVFLISMWLYHKIKGLMNLDEE